MNENVWFPIKISLKLVPKGLIKNIPALVQIMAYLNQWWLDYRRIYESLVLNELSNVRRMKPQGSSRFYVRRFSFIRILLTALLLHATERSYAISSRNWLGSSGYRLPWLWECYGDSHHRGAICFICQTYNAWKKSKTSCMFFHSELNNCIWLYCKQTYVWSRSQIRNLCIVSDT